MAFLGRSSPRLWDLAVDSGSAPKWDFRGPRRDWPEGRLSASLRVFEPITPWRPTGFRRGPDYPYGPRIVFFGKRSAMRFVTRRDHCGPVGPAAGSLTSWASGDLGG